LAHFFDITTFVGKINFLSFLYKDRFVMISYILYCQIKTNILFCARVLFWRPSLGAYTWHFFVLFFKKVEMLFIFLNMHIKNVKIWNCLLIAFDLTQYSLVQQSYCFADYMTSFGRHDFFFLHDVLLNCAVGYVTRIISY